ncbi:MAG TPA: hemerythrin domain-containing protein [Terriglobales bacterium]|nr:hemerythrin domain-containing protein [Terriglobales bacterium]
MLRDRNLVPLSRQHQHALAMCVLIRRALSSGKASMEKWRGELREAFASEIGVHFVAEEEVLFPEARNFPALAPLVEELLRDHAALRDSFQRAERGTLDAKELERFVALLDQHIRKEERQLFEQMQKLVPADRLEELGRAMQKRLSGPSCKVSY